MSNLIQAPVEVDLYNSGSYFNPEEVPLLAQSAMLALAEVVSRIAPLARVLVGLSDEGMNPLQTPHNCEHWTGRFRQALAVFNQTQGAAGLNAISCECHKLWLSEAQRV